ncbi:MAG: CoA pyrophosphatase [Thermoleophilia bacterium]|nr:CoA pyrophosphatase [Thermoleophilia bacterium]MDH3724923.1 CoA pyrophosphatase [Thermoleophilia bacterium]
MSRSLACPPPPPAELPPTPELIAILERALASRRPRRAGRPGRAAAVLLPLFERDAVTRMLLTKRSTDLVHHPGQVSLPGGRPEPGDPDLATTALRETKEEVAITPAQVRLIGRLDEMHTIASDFVITPYVGLVTGVVAPVPNDGEISRVLEVALADLLLADTRLPDNPGRLEVRYPLAGEDVWGATAHILRGFARIIRCALAEGL